jgi:hypothetical protein
MTAGIALTAIGGERAQRGDQYRDSSSSYDTEPESSNSRSSSAQNHLVSLQSVFRE